MTTTLAWDVSSDKTWCQVVKSGDKFTVTATPAAEHTSQGLSRAAAEDVATITVTAGGKSYTALTVTQTPALTKYPENIDDLLAAINKCWSVASGDYESLTLTDGAFTLSPRRPAAGRGFVDETPYPVVAGSVVIGADLRTVRLVNPDFSEQSVKFTDLSADAATVEFTAKTGVKQTWSLRAVAPADTRKPCRRLTNLKARFDGESFEYALTWQNGRLTAVDCKAGAERAVYRFNYPDRRKAEIRLTSATLDDGAPVDMTLHLTLDDFGSARRAIFVDNKTQKQVRSACMTYASDGSLAYSMIRDGDFYGTVLSTTQLEWTGGSTATEYTRSRFPWDSDGDGVPDQDWDGSGEIDAGDRILYVFDKTQYGFNSRPNHGRFMLPSEMLGVYGLDKHGISYMAYVAGLLGPGPACLQASCGNTTFSYLYDKEGYPTTATVKEPDETDLEFQLQWAWK